MQKAPLPVNVFVNGQPWQVAGGTTVADLLAQLGLPTRGIAVEVNQAIVPRARHGEQPLQDGDQLEVVSLVGGG
ncbi:MAG: sulfur carrier protein ThiS [Planctomycetaceae bacterium]|nr:sulfur carrier protein ThiS [Planctomycetaceae bacterium]